MITRAEFDEAFTRALSTLRIVYHYDEPGLADGEIGLNYEEMQEALWSIVWKADLERSVSGLLTPYMTRQIAFSSKTFGPGKRTVGITRHIEKECQEIREDPADVSEWIDVIILALDGYWRAGGSLADLYPALCRKQEENLAREWPAIQPEDVPGEHLGGNADKLRQAERERDIARGGVVEAQDALRALIDWQGIAHQRDCPSNDADNEDSCNCKWKALVSQVNAVLRAPDSASEQTKWLLKPERDSIRLRKALREIAFFVPVVIPVAGDTAGRFCSVEQVFDLKRKAADALCGRGA